MPESFLGLSIEDRRDALHAAALGSGRAPHLLEKDVWVVWTLRALFDAPFAKDIVFKGGTSLSKAYQAIDRFSEDVDITYDIRAIAPDLVPAGSDGLPVTRSQEQKWTKTIRERLEAWVQETVSPILRTRLGDEGVSARVTAEGDIARIEYEPLSEAYGYVRPVIALEFGARSTGEPSERRPVTCDAAARLPEVSFPEATPTVMRPERTFWEKATAVHVYCSGGRFRGTDRFSRHWYDLACLARTTFFETAIRDRALALRVARHKQVFFREKNERGEIIDYLKAVRGGLQLVPRGQAEAMLAEDYAGMVSDGLLFEKAPDFRALLARCREIQNRANQMR